MQLSLLGEPELEFGSGKHIDIRFGLRDYGPLDVSSSLAPKTIVAGLVGTPETTEGVSQWLLKCQGGIAAKASKQPRLFPEFPSMDGLTALRCKVVVDSSRMRSINRSALAQLEQLAGNVERVERAVQLFMEELNLLCENTQPQVIICAPPLQLLEALVGGSPSAVRYDFHHLLKARAMSLRVPIQIILPATYDETKARKQSRAGIVRPLQDEATRAWNIYCALYYKAGGTPWRLIRASTALQTCYVGVSFFESLDRSVLLTSVAQVFNERGEGVVVRGGTAAISKDDRQPHLNEEGAFTLLRSALARYKEVHRTLPARIVIHKSSSYSEEERLGFEQALAEVEIESYDLLHLRESEGRLYRAGVYPPLRGTMLELSEDESLLYTRGSVPFFETYPGLYVPKPTHITIEAAEQTKRFLNQEILALTKLNWNSTQFDGASPVTLRASREVSKVLRFCEPGQKIEPRYSFYM
ncbi:MAG: argonaute/piwi family protein [Acidobacteriaceae bacterium]